MKLALIPCCPTEWHDEGRLLGRVDLPATPEGEQRLAAWVALLRPLALAKLLHSPDELATRTAKLLGKALGVPTRAVDDLAEVDIGLWAGLTDEQLQTRFETVYRQLNEAPLTVVAPEGECLGDAAERLRGCLSKKLRKNGTTALGVVMRPVALALMLRELDRVEDAAVWEARQRCEPVVLDVGSAQLAEPGAKR